MSVQDNGGGQEPVFHSWQWPGGVDREPTFTLSLEHSVSGEEFPWKPLIGKCGILDILWVSRTLFMIHGQFEAELG